MMPNDIQRSHTVYQGGWSGTTPATVISEGYANEDIEAANLMIPQPYAVVPTMPRAACYYTRISLKYDYCPTGQIITSSGDLIEKDVLQEACLNEKPRNTLEWLGFISAKCLARSEFLTDPILGTKTETYMVKGNQEELLDEDLPVKLPPPRKSYIVKGRIISVEKAKPTALPLEEVSLLCDELLEDDSPVRTPPVKSYTVKGKIK